MNNHPFVQFSLTVRQLHREFLMAGADVIQAFTFSLDDDLVGHWYGLYTEWASRVPFDLPRKVDFSSKIEGFSARRISQNTLPLKKIFEFVHAPPISANIDVKYANFSQWSGIWKWVWFARQWMCKQSKTHSHRLHQDMFWNRGKRQLRNGVLPWYSQMLTLYFDWIIRIGNSLNVATSSLLSLIFIVYI